MGTIFKIALRNIVRHKRRTISSAAIIAVGIMFYMFMDGVMLGLDRGSIDNVIELSSSAVKLQTKAYEDDKEAYPLKHGITDVAEIRKHLSTDTRIVGVTPRAKFLGELSNYEQTVPVVGIVIDPATDTTVFALKQYVTGSFLSSDSKGVMVGKGLANDLGVEVGGFITLYALTKYDSRNADEFPVVGILNTTDPALNSSGVFMSYATANEFLDLEGLVTEVDIALKRQSKLKVMTSDADDVSTGIKKTFPNIAVATFMDISAKALELGKGKRAFGLIFLALLLLIAGIGIFNTVLMSVYERIREVGVLRAHGMPPSQVTLMFSLEGFMTGVLGSVIGLVFGGLITWYLVVQGYPLDSMYSDPSMAGDLPFWGTIYAEWNIPVFIALFLFGVLVSVVAGTIPARRAGKLKVTDALKFV